MDNGEGRIPFDWVPHHALHVGLGRSNNVCCHPQGDMALVEHDLAEVIRENSVGKVVDVVGNVLLDGCNVEVNEGGKRLKVKDHNGLDGSGGFGGVDFSS